jgi:hypothetical protein
MIRYIVGSTRKRSANRKNGARPSHWVGKRMERDFTGALETAESVIVTPPAPQQSGGHPSGDRAAKAALFRFDYCTFAPTTLSQFLVITSFMAACSSSVGNTAAS